MSDEMMDDNEKPFETLETIKSTPVAPAHAIATIALTMALKYHDINTVHDGTLYQQYKLEGKNLRELHLDSVFETAILMERHLFGSSDRIAKMLVECIELAVNESESESKESEP